MAIESAASETAWPRILNVLKAAPSPMDTILAESVIPTSTWNIFLGFLLTTVVGGLLSYFWSELARSREKNHQILSSRLENQRALLEDLAKDMGDRAFRAERLYWAVEDFPENPEVTPEKLSRLEKRWSEYYESVIAWNLNLPRYRMRVAFYGSREIAESLCKNAREGHSSESPTLHGKFAKVHKKVKGLVDMVYQRQPETKKEIVSECQATINELYDKIDDFLFDLQLAFRQSVQDEPWRRRLVDEPLERPLET
jgi:hypothetical protein